MRAKVHGQGARVAEAGPIDTAMVLAAGLGTRMRHLTADRPKPMVALGGRCLIDHVLDRLAGAGISHAVVNLHHHADLLERHLAGRKHPAIRFSCERGSVLDTGGGVKNALPVLGEEPFFVHNSDSVWIEAHEGGSYERANGADSNLARMIKGFDPDRMDALLLLADRETSLGYEGQGDFDLDASGLVRRRRQGEVVPFVFTGVSIAHPRMFADSPSGRFSMNVLWDRAMGAGRLFGLTHEGLWMHVGTPEALAEAEAQLQAHANGGGAV